MIERKTVSQCVSEDYCKGWNDAVDAMGNNEYRYETGFIKGFEAAQPKWISVEERLPKPETQVLILAKRGKYTVITNGMYEDGTLNTEDSDWHWYDNDFEYDEENDAYIIPAGWWEYKHYNGDDEYNHAIDDKVTHWMPLPEPLKETQ